MFKPSLCFALLALLPGLCLAKPQSDRTRVRNLTAFTRLWGYTKHWYPSDEVQDIDWDRFAVYGSRQVLDARNDAELKDCLDRLFRPLVPTLELSGSSLPHAKPAETELPLQRTFWQYEGYNNSSESSVYRSLRANRPVKIAKSEAAPYLVGSIFPQIPLLTERDTKLRLSFRVRQAEADTLRAALYAGYRAGSVEDSLQSDAWETKSYVLEGENDSQEPLWLAFVNFGSLYLDDLRVERWVNEAWEQLYFTDFERDSAGKLPVGLSVNIAPFSSYEPTNIDILAAELEGGTVLSLRRSVSELPYTLGIVDRIFSEVPEPDEILDKELVPGLYCRFPLSLACDLEHSYPLPDPAQLEALKQSYAAVDLRDRADLHVWLAGLIKYWNELSFFYPYFEYDLCDWDGELPLALARVLRCQDFAHYKQALLLLISQTRDGHAFLSDQAHNPKMPKFTTTPLEGKWVVNKVLDPSLDLPAGSQLTKMNGKNFAKLMRENRPYFIMGNPETTDLKLFSRYLKTYPDSVATFEFITPDRRKITRTCPFTEYEGWKWATPDAKIVKYPDGIVYLNPNAITEAEFQEALPDLVAARGIILDLRFYLRISTALLKYLQTAPDSLANTLIKRYIRPGEELPRLNEDKPTWGNKPAEPHIGAKVVALSGRQSQSYCEMYLAVLKHNQLATLVGQPSAGANGNVIITDLPGDLKVYWTGLLVRQADKSRFHGVGIIPDILVETTLDDLVQGRDPDLDKALELLRAE